MKILFSQIKILTVLSCLALMGCSGAPPYVYGTNDMTVSYQGEKLKIAENVMVCYNAEWANPNDVIGLARKECAKTKRQAQFIKHDFLACPVLLPARAYFQCVGQPFITESVLSYRDRVLNKRRTKAQQPIQQAVPMAEPELPPALPQHLK